MVKRKPPLEKEIANQICDYLKARGILCWVNDSVGIWDPKKRTFRKNKSKHKINGVSDILGILPGGQFLAIEVKRPGSNRVTADQKSFIAEARQQGGIAFVAWGVEDVEQNLSLLGCLQ